MRLRRVITWCAAVATSTIGLTTCSVAVSSVAPTLAADGSIGSGGSGEGLIWAGVQFSTSMPSSSTSSQYIWRTLTTYDANLGSDTYITKVVDGIRYRLYERIGPDERTLVWVPVLESAQLARQAAVQVRGLLPKPRLRMAPPADAGVVKVATWLWLDSSNWVPISVYAWIPTDSGPIWARTTATPVGLTFSTQDDGTPSGTRRGSVNCLGPGQVWQPRDGDDAVSSCMYTYRHSSTSRPNGVFTGTVGVRWRVAWTSNVGSGGALPNEVITTPVTVRVDELQALVD